MASPLLAAALGLAVSPAFADKPSWSFSSLFQRTTPLQAHLDCHRGLRGTDAPFFSAPRDGVQGFYFVSPHGVAFRPASEEANYFRVPMADPMGYFRCSRASCVTSNTPMFWGQVSWNVVNVFTGADDPQTRQALGAEITRLIAVRGDGLQTLADKPEALRKAGAEYSLAMDACAKVDDPVVRRAVDSRRR